MSKIRTRFAPSPTGRMHVGNLRTALYAYLISKHEGGDFILRIEDTDQERLVEGAVDIIYRTLEKTGLKHDEGPDIDKGFGPYVQSERQASGIYLEYAKKLIEKGEAYYCFCDKERLATLNQTIEGKEINVYDKHCLSLSKEEIEEKLASGIPYVIRQNNPTTGTTTFVDEIYGDITVDNSELDDMILRAQVVLCQYESAYHHIRFVNCRDKMLENTVSSAEEKEKLQCEMLRIVREEMETVQTLIDLRLQDSRIGFESSNHYFYTLQDLKEKMINLAYCEERLK